MKINSTELEVLEEEGNKQLNDLQQRNLNITKRNLIWSNIMYVPKLRPPEEKETRTKKLAEAKTQGAE